MGGKSVSYTVTVGLENGLHLVPCSRLVKLANGLGCDVRIRKGSINADSKNIFDLMGLAAACGDQLELLASGDGADEALAKIVALFQSDFAE